MQWEIPPNVKVQIILAYNVCSRATNTCLSECTLNKLYPVSTGNTTHYIPRERVRSSKASKAPRALPSALLERALSQWVVILTNLGNNQIFRHVTRREI